MKSQTTTRKLASSLLLSLAIGFLAITAQADPITPEIQAAADKQKGKLAEWAANPAVIQAVKESNAKGGIAGMSNAKWDDLADKDATVAGLQNNAAGKLVTKWEGEDMALGKLNLRDEKGNLVAFSSASGKPMLYNNANRPPFQNGMKAAWSDKEVKPDPTTQKKSLQISAPVMDGGKAIGVIHGALEAH